MKLSFFGAAGEVTGSCYLLETSRARVLIDFGLHQGGPGAEHRNRTFPAIEVDRLAAVVLTHAHIDHSGRLPLLPMHGYKGPIFATPATCDVAEILLRDSAEIQVMDAARANRALDESAAEMIKPLYGPEDAEAVLRLLSSINYDEKREIAPGVTVRFVDAGHILGSASVEMTVREGGEERVFAFSGDIGEIGSPLLRDPTPIPGASVVVMESTYGDRDHRSRAESVAQLAGVLEAARAGNGRIVIPAFAVGRTQQLVYHFAELYRQGKLGDTRVYVDSPMAVETTQIYRRHHDVMDEETGALIKQGDEPLSFPGLHYVRESQDSIKLNDIRSGIVIISASGMCTGGRVLHHLKHTLWQKESHIVIVGYQAQGSIGRQLVDGAPSVKIHRDHIPVHAKIHTIGGFSAHAGQSGLMRWATPYQGQKARMFLTHGEPQPREILRVKLLGEFGLETKCPQWNETVVV